MTDAETILAELTELRRDLRARAEGCDLADQRFVADSLRDEANGVLRAQHRIRRLIDNKEVTW